MVDSPVPVRGQIVGSSPKTDAFETTLKGEADRFYVGHQIQFVSGGLVRYSATIADYDGGTGRIMIDGSFPTAPKPGDDFIVQPP